MKIFTQTVVAVVGCMLINTPTVTAADSVSYSILFTTGESPIPNAGEIFNFAAAYTLLNGVLCAALYTANGNNPVILHGIDAGSTVVVLDSTTSIVPNGGSTSFPSSCSRSENAVVISSLLSDFVTQAHIVRDIGQDGVPVGPPKEIIRTGQALPNGTSLVFAENAVTAGEVVAFRNDIAGIFTYNTFTGDFDTVVDGQSSYPGSQNTVGTFSLPSIIDGTVAFSAASTGAENGLIYHDTLTGQLDLAYDFQGFGGIPQLIEVDSTPNALWGGFDPSTLELTISRYDGVNLVTYVSGGFDLSDGSDSVAGVGQLLTSSSAIFAFRGAGGNGVCAYYDATLASDPFGPAHLLRTCQGPMPAEPETVIILSPNQVVDDKTVTSWEVSAEAADGFDVVVLTTATDGSRSLVLIGDPGVDDADGDGVEDTADNCTLVENADQRDTNADNFGNACDPDLDNNGVINFLDISIFGNAFLSADPDADLDGDGVVNFVDYAVFPSFFLGAPGPSGTAQ